MCRPRDQRGDFGGVLPDSARENRCGRTSGSDRLPKPTGFPRMTTMAIRAKEHQVTLIRIPIEETSRPTPLAVPRLALCAAVDVVYVENAKVGFSADRAFAAEGFDKSELPFPMAASVLLCSVMIPILLSTFTGAKPSGSRFPALEAFASQTPSCLEIAGGGTESLRAVNVGLGRFAAHRTSDFGGRFGSHSY